MTVVLCLPWGVEATLENVTEANVLNIDAGIEVESSQLFSLEKTGFTDVVGGTCWIFKAGREDKKRVAAVSFL